MSAVAQSPTGAAPAPVETDRGRELRQTLLLLAIAALARLPFIWRGFGGHPDEWYVVRSGLDLWRHGVYYPSRVTGYLFNEVLMGGLAWLGGFPACGAAALLASLAALAYLRGLARLQGVANSFWMALAFSFEPWFWASGTHDLDYVWGTGALIAAFYYIERRDYAPAGLACALGFGFRPTSALWIAPLFLRVLLVERRPRNIVKFALWSAIPALVPAAVFVDRALASRPELSGILGGEVFEVTKVSQYPLLSPLLAAYHLIELLGQLPALVLIVAAGYRYRSRLAQLLREDGRVWIYILIFVLLFAPFVSLSEKPEYMLPALPGLFVVLGRCISDNWWKALTAAFIFNAFVSFGLGHSSRAGGLHLDLVTPQLRPGALMLYAERAKAQNDFISQVGAQLAEPSQIVRAGHYEVEHLSSFYVASVLTRGPQSQARISCPLIPALISHPEGGPPEIRRTRSTWVVQPGRPALVCCRTASALVLQDTPKSFDDAIRGAVAEFCRSDAETAAPR